MELIRYSKNHNTKLFLKPKLNELHTVSQINQSNKKNKTVKFMNKTKESIDCSIPKIIKVFNPNENRINIKNKSHNYFSSKNNKKQIKTDNFISAKINEQNIFSNKVNNIKSFKYLNLFLENESNNSKELQESKDNSNIELKINDSDKIKLSNINPINIQYKKATHKIKKSFHHNLLLDKIIQEKELEFEKENKIPSDKILLRKFKEKNYFSRQLKRKKPNLAEYTREITLSIEKKKNIPKPYNNYLKKTKDQYYDINKTFSFIRDNIEYDNKLNKERQEIKREKIKRLLNKNYNEIEIMKDAINIKNIHIVDNYIKEYKKKLQKKYINHLMKDGKENK